VRRSLANALWGEEQGYSLVEMVVVMAILGVVLSGLTTVFVGGSNAEISMNRRFQAQQQARLAIDRLRGDIHCASAAQAQTIGTYPGIKLAVANCSSATPTISWCAVQVSASPARYQLYRSTATSSICTTSDTVRVLVADYITSSSVFTTATIPQYSLQTVGVDLNVNVSPATATADAYRLTDSIVARNSTRCVTSGGCSAPAVP
jgi:prepilin-type N-terminal cleavage/methylation domain-containing protein